MLLSSNVMEILIITHGETEYQNKKSTNIDSSLSRLGISRIKQVSSWIKINFKFKNFFGLTSPYSSCLETATIIQSDNNIEFAVSQLARDYHSPKFLKGVSINSRKNKFRNIKWSDLWDKNKIYFKSDDDQDLKDRINKFVKNLSFDKNYLIVTHPTICRLIFSKLSNDNLEDTPRNSSINYMVDNKPIWFSKLVYD
jgi:broad specificity phosphatase PhoE